MHSYDKCSGRTKVSIRALFSSDSCTCAAVSVFGGRRLPCWDLIYIMDSSRGACAKIIWIIAASWQGWERQGRNPYRAPRQNQPRGSFRLHLVPTLTKTTGTGHNKRGVWRGVEGCPKNHYSFSSWHIKNGTTATATLQGRLGTVAFK